jgi:hypothetical protein
MRVLGLVILLALSVSGASLYGEYVVFERDGQIVSFDVARSQEKVIAQGSNPSLYGFIAAYETGDGIEFSEIRLGHKTKLNVTGNYPFVFSNYIVFSVKESELNEDINNDSDKNDDIIFEYDMNKKELTNLKAVGSMPVRNAEYLLFLTDESQIGVDLNADGDMSDSIVRAYDFKTRKTANLKLVANSLSIGKLNSAVVESDGEIVLVDAMSHNVQNTELEGSSPSIFGRTVIFSQDGEVVIFSIDDFIPKRVGIEGENPQIFDSYVVYYDNNGLQARKEGDLDKDEIGDFRDNCPAHSNVNQEDSDRDGVGDICDKSDDRPKVEQTKEGIKQSETSNETSGPQKESGSYWWLWLLLLIPLLPFIIKWAAKYHHRRRKSFGF